MNLYESLKKILEEWPLETQYTFKNNQLAKFIRADLVKTIEEIIGNDTYLVKASAGAGGWANIPWLSILDASITTSTRKEFTQYIYLSQMGQVCTFPLIKELLNLVNNLELL